MTARERLDVLRSAELLSRWDVDRLRPLLHHFDEVRVRAGDQIAVEGALCHQFFIVVDGLLQSCRRGVPGEIGRGDGFGWDAMRNRAANDASVYALTDAQLLVMGHAQFRAADAMAG